MQKTQWKQYDVSPQTVSTAVFTYLQSKGLTVNRKAGCFTNKNPNGVLVSR